MSTDNPYQSPAFETTDYNDIAALESQLGAREPFSVVDLLFSFQGRVGRLMYWAVQIACGVGILATTMITLLCMMPNTDLASTIALILSIPFYVMSLASQVKRWHDRNKSGWWILVGAIPMVGPLWVFIECGLLSGSDGNNNYGESPMF